MSDPQSHGTSNPIVFFDITLGGKSYLAITTISPSQWHCNPLWLPSNSYDIRLSLAHRTPSLYRFMAFLFALLGISSAQ